MKIFEFYFNPRAKGDRFYDTLFEEPRQSSLGNLYTVGELTNALPQRAKFLSNVADSLKKALYSDGKTAVLPKAIEKVNASFRKEIQEGNVSWLGNLHFAALHITADKRGKQTLTFTKAGNIKVLIARNAQIKDMDKDIAKSGIESSGSRVFGNIVSGPVSPGDKIFIITKDLFDVFSKERILSDIAFVGKEKQFQQLFKNKEKEFSKISGLLFAIFIEELPAVKIKRKGKEASPLLTFPKLSFSAKERLSIPFQSRFMLIALFLFLLIVGAVVFKGEREKLLQEAILAKERVVSLRIEAQNAQDGERENSLLQEAWRTTILQTKIGKPKRNEFLLLKQDIEERLSILNKVQKITNLESIFSIDASDIGFVPKRMILSSNNDIYLFNPFRSSLYKFSIENKQGQRISADRNIKLGTAFQDSVIFYAEPGVLLSLSPEQTWKEIPLRIPYSDATFSTVRSFQNNLYFFDAQAREIIKYGAPDFGQAFLSGKLWFDSETTQKPGGPGSHSIAVDGNIWVLQNGKELQRYFGGVFKESVTPLIFPFLENVSKIYTTSSLSNLYLLDSFDNRLIILTKFGKIVGQYENSKFGTLVDFAVSADGRSVYLLGDTDIYKIDVTSNLP